jgi:capsular polysaccharide biosynthesis protein
MFVASLPKGRVYGPAGDIVTPDGQILTDISLLFPDIVHRENYKQPVFQRLTQPNGFPVLQQLQGTVCSLASQYATSNYFHWMFNELPRLELIHKAGLTASDIDIFITNPLCTAFQRESLEILEIPSHKVLEAGDDFYAEADQLVVTSTLRISGHRSRWAHDFLRQSFMMAASANTHQRRLYISRADAGSRRLENEAECLSALAPLGFEKVCLGGLSIREQAALFASAKVIVAPHGAALTNLVFCHPGTHVVELFSPTWPRTYYWELSNCARLHYAYLIGEVSTADAVAVENNLENHDFSIQIKSLLELLTYLEIR